MLMVEAEKVKEIQDQLRDTINWVQVFEDEYNLDKEVVDTLRQKLEDISAKIGALE